MKKIFFLILFCAFSINAYTQDIIILKNNTKVEAKIIEVGLEIVKYVKYNNQNGPTILLDIEKINSIIYENGEVTSFLEKKKNNYSTYGKIGGSPSARTMLSQGEIDYKEFRSMLNVKYPELVPDYDLSMKLNKQAKILCIAVGLPLFGGGLAMICVQAFLPVHPCLWYIGGTFLAGSVVSFGIGLSFSVKSGKLLNKCLNTYDYGQYNKKYTLNVGITGSGGIGLNLVF